MTQKKMAIVIGTWVSFSIAQGCGMPPSRTHDPLLGAWTRADQNHAFVCEFFGNGEWGNGCFITSGWGGKWERLEENRYYIGYTYGTCDAETAFSADDKAVTLSMLCGTPQMETVLLSRLK